MTDELFTIPATPPDALTLARNRLEKASAAYDLAIAESERAEIALIDTRADWIDATKQVAKLETERLKGAK